MAFFTRTPPEAKTPVADPPDGKPPSLSPLLTVIAADLVLRAGESLVRRGVERGLLGGKPAQSGRVIRGATLQETVIGTVMAEVARRSVPGAILVGGGLLAKALRDRRLARTDQAKAALPKPDGDNIA
jgi:hypothetical protein